MSVHIARAGEHERRPWRNGGGMTTELASSPADADADADFVWRISMAEVTQPGAFSRFPGVDRVITLVDGTSMTLHRGEQAIALRRFEPFGFDGDDDIACDIEGPCRDLNVMTRRGRASATVEVWSVDSRREVSAVPGHEVLVIAVEGRPGVAGTGDPLSLEVGDVVTSDEPLEVCGEGRVAVVQIFEPSVAGDGRSS